MPRWARIAGWFGQVGSECQTVAPGAARRISSKSWRMAPVPPGVCAPASRSPGTAVAEGEVGHRRDEAEVAEEADVGLAVLLVEQPPLGGLDRAHHRRAAVGVLVDADAEVDLVGARVGAEECR